MGGILSTEKVDLEDIIRKLELESLSSKNLKVYHRGNVSKSQLKLQNDERLDELDDSNATLKGSLRFVCISDTHNDHETIEIPEGDVLIHAGDMTKWTSGKSALVKFNEWLGRQPHRYKIVIGGNHDKKIDPKEVEKTQAILSNATYLQDSFTVIDGVVKVYGSPWHVDRGIFYRANAFGLDNKSLSSSSSIRRRWNMIPDDVDILVTHVPPYGIRDVNHRSKHMGCELLLEQCLTRIKPTVHIFGHNHDDYGVSRLTAVDRRVLDELKERVQKNSKGSTSQTIEEEDSDESLITFINAAQYCSRRPIVFEYHFDSSKCTIT